jgi:hypothetical protein
MLSKQAGKVELILIADRAGRFCDVMAALLKQVHGPLKPQADQQR